MGGFYGVARKEFDVTQTTELEPWRPTQEPPICRTVIPVFAGMTVRQEGSSGHKPATADCEVLFQWGEGVST